MALDAYSACPCGSGKKFKWCCQPIHERISKAFQLQDDGQSEQALQIMNELIADNASNPEVWGRKAMLLFQQEKAEEAEAALQKAFEINEKYPFGHYLQGMFRHREGEIAGALILFRKAARYYDPESRAILSNIHGLIFDCEINLNHPVAARAALEIAHRLNPSDNTYSDAVERISSPESGLPEAARKAYVYKPLPANAAAERKAAWEKALASGDRLEEAAAGFQHIIEQDASDASAWYNLGLTQAWMGMNGSAVESLDRYVALENDEEAAADAWALAEVLRCGQGMENSADVVESVASYMLQDLETFSGFLEKLQKEQRLVGAQVSEDGSMLTALVLEKLPPALTPEHASKQTPRLGAAMMLLSNLLTLRNTNVESLDKVVDEFAAGLGPQARVNQRVRAPARFTDLFSEVMVFPLGAADQAEAEAVINKQFEKFYEETWLHRPLKSLGGVAPIDAKGSPVLRRKLLGVIQFLEQSARLNSFPYDFDRLRRKLDLLDGTGAAGAAGAPASAGGAAPEGGGGAVGNIAEMGTGELASLDAATLSAAQLEQAFQAARKLDAGELAGNFAETLLAQPADAEKPDRFLWANYLIQLAQQNGEFDKALEHLDAGEKYDCENNEGRRRNDYELKRGQLLCKQGKIDEAVAVFDALIARDTSELKYLSTAAESMLSARQGAKALGFAEKGLAAAREKNNGDMEGFFLELCEAARKHGS